MEIDTDKVDEAVLALLYLTLHDGARAWKGFDWDTLNRLHAKGFISATRLARPNPSSWPMKASARRSGCSPGFRPALASVAALQASHIALPPEHQKPMRSSLRKAIAIEAARRMKLAPKPEQRLRYPAPQVQRMMQPHVAANAERNEQGLRLTAIATMDHEPPCRATGAASETITLKDQLAQAAEPAQRAITAIIAEAAAAASL
jgi:Domain of unknown function (DUF6429)